MNAKPILSHNTLYYLHSRDQLFVTPLGEGETEKLWIPFHNDSTALPVCWDIVGDTLYWTQIRKLEFSACPIVKLLRIPIALIRQHHGTIMPKSQYDCGLMSPLQDIHCEAQAREKEISGIADMSVTPDERVTFVVQMHNMLYVSTIDLRGLKKGRVREKIAMVDALPAFTIARGRSGVAIWSVDGRKYLFDKGALRAVAKRPATTTQPEEAEKATSILVVDKSTAESQCLRFTVHGDAIEYQADDDASTSQRAAEINKISNAIKRTLSALSTTGGEEGSK